MKKHNGMIVIMVVSIFMILVTVTAGVIELSKREDITTVPQDKIEELTGVPIAEQDADASNKGFVEQDKIALGIMKDGFIANVKKCIDSMDYTTVQSCVTALENIFPEEIVKEEPIEEELLP